MVFFSCDECGESLKKNQVEKHTYRCRSYSFSCIDCQVRFTRTTFTAHIKCITENQKYGSKDYVEKEAKGETKQQAWVALVSGAIANVTDTSLKSLLQKIQDYDNIPRKEAKFINFLGNSFRIQNRGLCQRAWNAIQEESEKLKKQMEEEKKVKEAANSKENEANKATGTADKDANENVQESKKDEETQEITFKWKASIKRKLKEAGGEMKVKRLRKAVISDYEQAGGDAEDGAAIFDEKLQKSGVTVDGKLAQLA